MGSSPNPFIAQCRDVRRVSGGGGSQIGLKLLRGAPPSQAGMPDGAETAGGDIAFDIARRGGLRFSFFSLVLLQVQIPAE